MSIRDIRRRARSDLHAALQVPALYIEGEVRLQCRVRVHNYERMYGDLPNVEFGGAGRREQTPEIVTLVAEVEPKRNGVFSILPGEAYRVETRDPPDGITRTVQVTRVDGSDAEGLPLPEGIA